MACPMRTVFMVIIASAVIIFSILGLDWDWKQPFSFKSRYSCLFMLLIFLFRIWFLNVTLYVNSDILQHKVSKDSEFDESDDEEDNEDEVKDEKNEKEANCQDDGDSIYTVKVFIVKHRTIFRVLATISLIVLHIEIFSNGYIYNMLSNIIAMGLFNGTLTSGKEINETLSSLPIGHPQVDNTDGTCPFIN